MSCYYASPSLLADPTNNPLYRSLFSDPNISTLLFSDPHKEMHFKVPFVVQRVVKSIPSKKSKVQTHSDSSYLAFCRCGRRLPAVVERLQSTELPTMSRTCRNRRFTSPTASPQNARAPRVAGAADADALEATWLVEVDSLDVPPLAVIGGGRRRRPRRGGRGWGRRRQLDEEERGRGGGERRGQGQRAEAGGPLLRRPSLAAGTGTGRKRRRL